MMIFAFSVDCVQRDQMARFIFKILAIYNKENWNSGKNLPKYGQKFGKY